MNYDLTISHCLLLVIIIYIGATVAMPTYTECICCCELEKMVGKMEETGASCITEHERFDVCLNRWVLQTAYFQYRQQYGNHHEDTPIHKYMHTCMK